MSKIVCDICGTQYDEAEGSCPVCGWNQSNDVPADADDFDVDFLDTIDEEPAPAAAPVAPVPEAPKNKVTLDLDSANGRRRPAPKPAPKKQEEDDEDDEDEDDEEEEESGSNAFLVIILVILILALLAVSAYIGWTKIIKPKGDDSNKPVETTQVIEVPGQGETETTVFQPATETVEVAEPTVSAIPCTDIALAGNVDTLFIGQYWRLMAKATPENTTDKIVYSSSDPSVVTIDDYGRVTALGEGKAVITVTCGSKSLEAPVVVKSSETDVQSTTAPTAAAPAEGTSGNTAASSPAGTTVATPSAGFSLKKHDITIGRLGVYVTLEVEGGVSAESIKWSTSDSGVATVFNGNVTCVGRGVCIITAEYNGQSEQCIVRCKY